MRHSTPGAFARATVVTLATTLTVAGLAGLGTTSAQAKPTAPSAKTQLFDDTRDAGAAASKAKLTVTKAQREAIQKASKSERRSRLQASAEPGTGGVPIGGEKTWLTLDDTIGQYVPVTFVLQTVGTNIEIWVQKDINFPAGDCRNDGIRNIVTRAQTDALAAEFDNNILPKESAAFSVAPARDGADAPLAKILELDPGYYAGDGNKTVTLVSNVRDTNFYTPTVPEGQTRIGGFFSSQLNGLFERNVMSIDAYDWIHRTGANPLNDGPENRADPCPSGRPGYPRQYEGTFAHEYQHLPQSYQDEGETIWLNEGLSDYAQTLVGYVDSTLPYGVTGADSHITCFQGYYGDAAFPYCGAENSLTRWGDQGAASTLADYGAAYTFLTYLADQFGDEIVTYLHRSKAHGLVSLQNWLDDNAPGLQSIDVIHDWAAQMTLDRFVDKGAKGLTRDQRNRFTSAQLSSAIDWSWSGSYDSPGAPANGSDYVLAVKNRPINVNTIKSMRFRGTKTYAPDPLAWVVDDGTLYAGTGDNLDRSAVFSVTVPAGSPKLTFSNKYNIETGWDFAVVQVSTDGGKTYTSLANANTTSEHEPEAVSSIVNQLPGLTGVAADFRTETFNLAPYAGKDVLLSFRYLTDPAVNGADPDSASGWWIKDVKVDSMVVTTGATLESAQSATQATPTPVAGWKVQAIGWKINGTRVRYADIKLNDNFAASLSKKKLGKLFKGADRIGFIVTVSDPAEMATKNANYRLRVNGRLQPGGTGDVDATAADAVLAAMLPVSERIKFR